MKPPKKIKPGEKKTFIANPYYDDILLFADVEVPTTQESYKLVDSEKGLYEKRGKPKVSEFKAQMRKRLIAKKKPWWPFTVGISLDISISGPKRYIEMKDLDNFLKTIFDTIKGIVIADDHKIVSVTVDKTEVPFVSGFGIAIKNEESKDGYVYSKNRNNWKAEMKSKIERGGTCGMDFY